MTTTLDRWPTNSTADTLDPELSPNWTGSRRLAAIPEGPFAFEEMPVSRRLSASRNVSSTVGRWYVREVELPSSQVPLHLMRLLRRAWHEHWALSSEAVASVGQLLSLLDVPGPAAPQLSFDEEEGAVELLWLVNGESLNAFVQRDGSVEVWGMDESGREIFSFVGLPNEGSSDHSRALSFLASLSARVRVPL